MRLQDTTANCGPLAVRNALKALGLERSTEELETLLGTTATEGTPTKRLVKGLLKMEELNPRVIDESREMVAHLSLSAGLRSGRPTVLCVDDWTHWVAAVGTLGDSRVLVADSADSELVVSLGWQELMQRWASTAKRPYWGVVL